MAFGGFVLDAKRRTLSVGGTDIRLHAKAFDILAYLAAQRGRAVTREELLHAIWNGQAVAESNLTVQMSNLRRALADHGGGELIITLPRVGYQFIADVVDASELATAEARTFAPTARDRVSANPRALLRGWRVELAAFACAIATAALSWNARAPSAVPTARSMIAHVRVEAVPDEVYMTPGSLRFIDYKFTILDAVDLQLETEDWQFALVSGQPVGPGVVGGRIYRGSFPIKGNTTGIYHNNIYLMPQVVELARATGHNAVQIRHLFHLRDPQGNELRVPAVLMIHLDPWVPLQ